MSVLVDNRPIQGAFEPSSPVINHQNEVQPIQPVDELDIELHFDTVAKARAAYNQVTFPVSQRTNYVFTNTTKI